MKISILMPAHNEEDKIKNSIEESVVMLRSISDFEVIVIDDGSTDRTREEALAASHNPCVRVVGYSVNRGKGNALKYGFRYVTGDIVVFMDSDSEIKPMEIKNFITALSNGDVAIGSKSHHLSRVKVPIMRRFLSYSLHVIVRLLLGIRVSDTQSGFKASRRSALAKILPLISVKSYAFDIELLTVASMQRMKIIELPVDVELSASFSLKHVLRMLVDIMGITYRLRVIRWYQRNLENGKPVYKSIIRW